MKAVLAGGSANGREIDVAPTSKTIRIPTLENPFAAWREEDEGLEKPAFGAEIYSRTDERNASGAVIFICTGGWHKGPKLDTKGKS